MSGVDLLAIGEVMLELSAPGPLEQLPPLTPAAAGDTFNVAAVAASLGAHTAYAGLIGDDPAGDAVLADARRRGVDTRYVARVSGRRTGLYLVSTDPDGERTFHYYRSDSAATAMTPCVLDRVTLAEAHAVHTSGITMRLSSSARATAVNALRDAYAQGRLTSYDVNFRPTLATPDEALSDLRAVARYVRLLSLSTDDARALCGTTSPREAAARLGVASDVVILVGEAGAGATLVTEAGRECLHVDAPPVTCLDSSGAGDALVGAFLAARLAGLDAGPALCRAVAAAAHAIGGRGALGAVPTCADVDRLVAEVGAR